jgi:hypothetical protein
MSTLDDLLENPDVTVHRSGERFEQEQFGRWAESVEREENRAVSGIIHDRAGQLLLVQYEDGFSGWRLPGNPVGHVHDFEARLDDQLGEQFGLSPKRITPTEIQAHTARHGGDEATYYSFSVPSSLVTRLERHSMPTQFRTG